ncbi:MAG: C4-dicarboxylate ABC transporter [Deltaproteobacteria bacterium HGW-Deltaproteobacteria-21]|nr:MAG: C4-dicarboxylate ABC transporter [Deltaproteobacteria bacterium HGW-Deltaproteobacteria-21]
MSPEILGLVALGSLFVFIFVGFPIAFTLLFLGLVTGYIGIGQVVFNLMTLQVYAIMNEQVLSAVPFFLFMGYILESSGLMERLFKAFQMMLARVSGSLYIAVTATATIFAAATGIVGSSVTLLGVMAGPTMRQSCYDVKLSAGCITAGGTLGILIPPSIMLVVMGPVVGVPVTDLFAAAIIPGIILAGLYCGYCLIRCKLNPTLGPCLSEDQRIKSLPLLLRELALGVLPVTAVILATLGTIMFGVATPTEGAACGAIGSLVLASAYRRVTWKSLLNSMYRTVEISAMILLLCGASNFFGAVFSRLGSATMLTNLLLAMNLDPMVMLVAILLLIFVLGWPLEWVPIVLIIIPIIMPMVRELGYNLIWFCTLVAVTLQTAWLSPPVALSAYFLKGVVPQWSLKEIYSGMAQFMALQFSGAAVLILFPALTTWLPLLLRK